MRVARIEPLQIRIERNRLKFAGFMVAFTAVVAVFLLSVMLPLVVVVVLLVFGSLTGPVTSSGGSIPWGSALWLAAGLSLVAAWAWALYRLSRSEVWLVRRLEAKIPAAGTLLPTKSALHDMSVAAGLSVVPQLYVIDTPKVNACVLGRSPELVRVGVTTGFLERIAIGEQRAVFANLLARVLTRDTLWATAVSALMGPIWAMRDHDLRYEPVKPQDGRRPGTGAQEAEQDPRAGVFLLYSIAVVVTEVLAWYHRKAAWTAAEKADAEGMMLLKDPRWMLRAIENVLERDNFVPTAGEAYSQLFFCWAGYGFAPEDDPEMRRVARLRETLGAEGAHYVPRPNVPGWSSAPKAPRIEPEEGPVLAE